MASLRVVLWRFTLDWAFGMGYTGRLVAIIHDFDTRKSSSLSA